MYFPHGHWTKWAVLLCMMLFACRLTNHRRSWRIVPFFLFPSCGQLCFLRSLYFCLLHVPMHLLVARCLFICLLYSLRMWWYGFYLAHIHCPCAYPIMDIYIILYASQVCAIWLIIRMHMALCDSYYYILGCLLNKWALPFSNLTRTQRFHFMNWAKRSPPLTQFTFDIK